MANSSDTEVKPGAAASSTGPSTGTEGLAQAARAAGKRGPPPVHLWNPPFCGDLDIEIRRDGSWFYLGTPIGRFELTRLFASILKREGDRYFLVTPVEKVGIRVADVPFIATDAEIAAAGQPDQAVTLTTAFGDSVIAGPDHPLRVVIDPETGAPAPYVMIRRGLEARIDRKTFYRLVDWGHCEGGWFGLRSGGQFFPILPEDQLGL